MHRILKYSGKPENKQDELVEENLKDFRASGFGDVLSEMRELALVAKASYGVLVQILNRIEEATSVSQGQYLTVYQNVAVTNTLYKTQAATINGVVRGFVLSGTGNITVQVNGSNFSPSGKLALGTFNVNSIPLAIPFRISMREQNTFSLSTDSAASGIIGFMAWLEPISLTGKDKWSIDNAASI